MRKKVIFALFGVALSLFLILSVGIQPKPSVAKAKLTLSNPKATPKLVQLGKQPDGNPLFLSVTVRKGATEISTVTVNLAKLMNAKYYNPSKEKMCSAGGTTPMFRVHYVDGNKAYKIDEAEYLKAVTHDAFDSKIIKKATIVPTSTYQVELLDVGTARGNFDLTVTATDKAGNRDTATISLKIVDDTEDPTISAEVEYLTGGTVARWGDKVAIEAKVSDDLTGIFSVGMDEETEMIFGERQGQNLALERQGNTDLWRIEDVVAEGAELGRHLITLTAEDRAGNSATSTVEIEVAEEIPSYRIELKQGWNLISVPKDIDEESEKEFLESDKVEGIFTFIGGERTKVMKIEPGRGYFVKAEEDTKLTVNFKDCALLEVPSVIEFGKGWNLVGYASRILEPEMPLKAYLRAGLEDEWVVVYTEDFEQARPYSVHPFVWATRGFPTVTGEPYSEDPSHNLPKIEIGRGYWIYLSSEGTLIP